MSNELVVDEHWRNKMRRDVNKLEVVKYLHAVREVDEYVKSIIHIVESMRIGVCLREPQYVKREFEQFDEKLFYLFEEFLELPNQMMKILEEQYSEEIEFVRAYH